MKKSIHNILIASFVIGTSVGSLQAQDKSRDGNKNVDKAYNQNAHEDLDQRAKDLNRTVNKGDSMPTALKYISVETGVPEDRVQAMHKRHSEAGPADILNACVLADETKKEPEDFLKRHQSGKGWMALARENNVPVEKMTVRLDRLDKALSTGGTTDRRNPDSNKRDKK